MFTAVNNKLFATVDNKKEIERKAPLEDSLTKGGGEVAANTGLGERKIERNPTPPHSSSSSKTSPVDSTDKNDENSVEKNDDDEKNQDSKNPCGVRDNDIHATDTPNSEVRAAKKPWQQLADQIEAFPSEEITSEAKELAAYVTEKVPRIEYGRAARLAQRCIEEKRVIPLGSAVGLCEDPCKSSGVGNPYAYLLKSLAPPLGDEDPEAAVGDRFWAAYEEAQPLPTLNGAASKHKQYGTRRKPARSTADYRRGGDIEAARRKRREQYPSDIEKYLEPAFPKSGVEKF